MIYFKGYLKDQLPKSNTRKIYYLKASYTATPVFSLAINSARCTTKFSRLTVTCPLRESTDCHMSSQRVDWLSLVLSESRRTVTCPLRESTDCHMPSQRVEWLSHVLSESRLTATCPLRESVTQRTYVLFVDGSIAYVFCHFYIQINRLLRIATVLGLHGVGRWIKNYPRYLFQEEVVLVQCSAVAF